MLLWCGRFFLNETYIGGEKHRLRYNNIVIFSNPALITCHLFPGALINYKLWIPPTSVTCSMMDYFCRRQKNPTLTLSEFPNSFGKNECGAFVQTKMATNNKKERKKEKKKKSTTKVILSWIGAVLEVLAVTQRSLGAGIEQHSLRAAGSHFLPAASQEQPIVTPEELREEVTTGQHTVLESNWSDYAHGTCQR